MTRKFWCDETKSAPANNLSGFHIIGVGLIAIRQPLEDIARRIFLNNIAFMDWRQ